MSEAPLKLTRREMPVLRQIRSGFIRYSLEKSRFQAHIRPMIWYFADYHINSPVLALALLALGALPVVLSIVSIVRIVQRAGFSGRWTLLIFVPVVNMAVLWYFAFAERPVTRRGVPPRNANS